jgi:hypothetical protein
MKLFSVLKICLQAPSAAPAFSISELKFRQTFPSDPVLALLSCISTMRNIEKVSARLVIRDFGLSRVCAPLSGAAGRTNWPLITVFGLSGL